MIETTAEIKNEAGIHVRPSGVIIKELTQISSKVYISSKGMEMELSSVMGLLALGLHKGDQVIIRVEGGDEEPACQKLKELLETQYDFPSRD
jgi:phosphocarrier protein HPr